MLYCRREEYVRLRREIIVKWLSRLKTPNVPLHVRKQLGDELERLRRGTSISI